MTFSVNDLRNGDDDSYDRYQAWQTQMGDWDLGSALGENGVTLSDIPVKMIAKLSGEADGASWHWVVQLADDTYAYITGACDYTGWDCVSNCEAYEAVTLSEVMKLIPEAERGDLQTLIDENKTSNR